MRIHHLILTTLTAVALSLVPVATNAWQDEKHGEAITDPMHAGIAYEIQGEYKGKIDEIDMVVGVQVRALGKNDDGKETFGLVVFMGGLPGEGGQPNKEGEPATPSNPVMGVYEGDQAVFQDERGKAVIKDGTLSLMDPGTDEVHVTLEKVERKSPTLGMKAPEGATVLFDGTNTDAFDNAKMVGEYLAATGATSKEKFGDHQLHIEFRTPFMPQSRGQQRGNSGVYMQARYELQVLDSFSLERQNNECGGIYSIAKPAVNMCFPPLTWQTYDIDFKAARYNDAGEKTENARATIKHNGVVIHDDLELPHGTPGFHEEGPGPDVLFLQDHGNPVVFRNIWVIKK